MLKYIVLIIFLISNIFGSNMLTKPRKPHEFYNAVFMKNFDYKATHKQRKIWLDFYSRAKYDIKCQNMKRFKCALHQTNDFFSVRRNAIHMYLVSSSSEHSGLKSEKKWTFGKSNRAASIEEKI